MVNKKNIPLYLALAVPLLMILVVVILVYLPGIGKSPKINFLYATGDQITYDYYNRYYVSGNHLNVSQDPVPNYQPSYNKKDVHFYIYDVIKKEASEISFNEAQQLNLDPSNISSDGYVVTNGSNNGGFPFGGPSDYNSFYIRGHNRSQKLNLKLSGSNYYSNFRFLGWIK